MNLMNESDFTRLMSCWQAAPQNVKPPLFDTPPGVCWFKNYEGFPFVEALQHTLFEDLSVKETRSAKSPPPLSLDELLAEDDNSEAEAVNLASYLEKKSIHGARVEPVPGMMRSVWTIVSEKDSQNGLYRYLLYSEDVNIAFRDMVSGTDLVRNIFIADMLRDCHPNIDYNGICGSGSDCYQWDYRVIQSASLEGLQKQIERLGYIREKASEVWGLFIHVVNEILSFAIIPIKGGLPEIQISSYEPAPEGCFEIDPLVSLFWRCRDTEGFFL